MLVTIAILVVIILIAVYGPTSNQGWRLIVLLTILVCGTGILLIAPMCLPTWSDGTITLDNFLRRMMESLFDFRIGLV